MSMLPMPNLVLKFKRREARLWNNKQQRGIKGADALKSDVWNCTVNVLPMAENAMGTANAPVVGTSQETKLRYYKPRC